MVEDGGGASRRWQRTLSIGLGLDVGDGGTQTNLVTRAPAPTILFIALCDGAHQPCRVGPPIRARDQGPSGRWAVLAGRST